MRYRLLSLAAAAVLLAACGGPKPTVPGGSSSAGPDKEKVSISGDASAPVNQLAIKAIGDLQEYWSKEFPQLYGSDYKPVEGGFFAVTPSSGDLPPCASEASDISGNAFYCSTKDVVAWDAESLLPELQKKFGDFVIPMVLAHEWGHAIQGRSNFTAKTVTREIQADCFAGAWAKHAKDDGVFKVSDGEMDSALAGIITLRDTPGTSASDTSAHGSGFDRVNAFQDGFDNGPKACKDYRDDEPAVIELPFNDAEDAARGGDAPYDSIINGVPYDLEDYWTQVYPELTNGDAWTPVKGLKPFDPASPPPCGGSSTEGYSLFYCVPDDYIAWDNVDEMPHVYSQGGDFAVATLLATQYGLADDVQRQGSGFDRVRHYRDGVINGAEACLKDQ